MSRNSDLSDMSKKKTNAAGTVGFIFIAIFLSKILGQVREMAIAAFYGTSAAANAYVIASQLPVNFFDMVLGTAVSSAFIPVYNKFMQQEGKSRANLFASRFLNAVILITTLICAAGIIFAPQIISVFAPEMSAGEKSIAVGLLKIMFPIMIFTGMAFTLVGILQSLDEFKIPAIMSLISNAVCILYLVTTNSIFGITGLAVAFLVGWIMQFVILVRPASKLGFKYKISAGVKDSGLKEVAVLALPVLAASWVQPINTTVNMALASGLEGGIASLNYANRLYIIAASVFAVSVTNYIFPKMSQMFIGGENENWSKMVASGIKYVLMAVIPISLVFLIQGKEIIRIVYQRGQFGESDVQLTSMVMFFYSLGMVFYSIQEICNKAFYSARDTKTPMFSAIGGILTNVVLSVLLSKSMGISGLALAASVSACVWSIFLLIRLRGKMKKQSFKGLELSKTFIMCAGFAAAVFFARSAMINTFGQTGFLTSVLNFGVPFLSGAAAYIVLALMLKIKEIDYIKSKFWKEG